MVDTVIRNGNLVSPKGIFKGIGLAIEKGKVVAIAGDSHLPDANKVIDAKGNYILPGLVDPHVHFREPAFPDCEDFEHGTKSAAAGGVTTIFEMNNSLPPVYNVENLKVRKKAFEGKGVVDLAFYGGATGMNIEDIPKLTEAGVIGYKSFMPIAQEARIEDFKGFAVEDDGALLDASRKVAKTGLVHVIHAESGPIWKYFMNKAIKEGKKDIKAWYESRPPVCEIEAAQKCILFQRITGNRLDLCHITLVETVDMIRKAKATGRSVTADVATCHLFLTVKDGERLGPYGTTTPPLRTDADVAALWKGLCDGTIDMVISDHAPFTRKYMDPGYQNIWECPLCPMGSVEQTGPLMFTAVNKGDISLERVAEVASEAPARIFGIYPKKGAATSVIGSDADVIIVDMKKKFIMDHNNLQSKGKETFIIFDGFEIKGAPSLTMVRGEVVMDEGEIVGKLGFGKWIPGPGLLTS